MFIFWTIPFVYAGDQQGSRLRETIKKLIDSNFLDDAERRLNLETAGNGESLDTYYLKALLLFKRKQFGESLMLLEQSLIFERGDPDVHKLIALNGIAQNRLDIAESALNSAILIVPTDVSAHFHLGTLYFITNRFALAEGEFQRVIELRPGFMKAHDFLGLAQEELRSDDAVIASYLKAIQLVEQQGLRDEGPYLHLAKFLWLRNRFSESEPFARSSVRVNPESAEAWYVLGRLLSRSGQTDEAEKALLTAIRKDPKYSEPRYFLSQLYRKLGHSAEADTQFQLFEEARKNAPR